VVTEECLLHPSRNPHYGKAGIEAVLKEYLGLEKIIWLWKGVAGDDSVVNGHVGECASLAGVGVGGGAAAGCDSGRRVGKGAAVCAHSDPELAGDVNGALRAALARVSEAVGGTSSRRCRRPPPSRFRLPMPFPCRC
jgi:hypothetical protein